MAKWSIKLRIALTLLIGVMLALFALLVLLEADYAEDAEENGSLALRSAQESFADLQSRDTAMLAAVLDSLMDREDLRAALAEEDTATLLAVSSPLYRILEERRGITHLYFMDPEGHVLLRVHRPEQSGDLVTRSTFGIAERTAGYGSGLDLGKTAFALRVVHPLYRGGSSPASQPGTSGADPIIGYMEVGEEIEHFMSLMPAHGMADNYTLLLSKTSLKHEDWAAYRRSAGLRDDWNDHPDYVVAGTSSAFAPEYLDKAQLPVTPGTTAQYVGIIYEGPGRSTAVGHFPVRDALGRPVGLVLMSHDLSSIIVTIRRTQYAVAAVILVLTLVMGIVLFLMLDRLVFRRLGALAREGMGAGLKKEISLTVERDPTLDEIGRFENELAIGRRELEIKSILLDSATDAIWVTDLKGQIVYANEAAVASRGYSRSELMAMNVSDLAAPGHATQVAHALERTLEDGRAIYESVDFTKSGDEVPVEVHSSVTEAGGEPVILSVSRDLSERYRAEQAMQQLAYFDPLTGVANRRLLDDRLLTAMARVRRSGGCLGVVFLDLDRLKPVNDSLGHSGGDVVLSAVAQCLLSVVRETDTVARVGGDEFVLLLCDTDPEAVALVVPRTLTMLERPVLVGHTSVRVTASAGVALYRGEDETPESLLRQADLAMYAAKAAGRNRYTLFDSAMGTAAYERFELQQELASAFENDELTLNYQPLVRLRDGAVIGAEALCRWFGDDRDPISPERFIPAAEESGLIVPIGRWVITEACRQAREWQDSGLPLMRVSVNVSVHQFSDERLVETVKRAIDDNGIAPGQLGIEVTEGTALGGSDKVRATLNALHELGVSLAVDDFGIGYSALDSIASQPFDALKVDRSFVAAMQAGPERKAIVRTVVDLGSHLGMETIAEGVEYSEQAAWLLEMECDYAQGFLYSPALPADDFRAYAARHQGNLDSP
ncbi:MAG: EAL domain-containing protein [Coriobacteriia bacterium]|nr:EAL domain-containing protein [Coriobacteriia bacterium]